MTVQRRRGTPVTIYPSKVATNSRGEKLRVPNMDKPIKTRGAFIPQRSARAEVPGQQEINVTRMIVSADIKDVDVWSRVKWMGKDWDVVTPPAYHHGVRGTRHLSIDIRERP